MNWFGIQRRLIWLATVIWLWASGNLFVLPGAENVYLTQVPDYDWWRGCFGTATGNLMGYWDRHGFPNYYTGPTAGGIAPLNSFGGNAGIRSLWASKAGFDGRPANQYGHEDDYWIEYERTEADPYVTAGRPEHSPDCIGDFIGLNQLKWHNMNGECDGNIDGFVFTFWDHTGAKRLNYVPPMENGLPVRDVPSGLKAWTEYRGSSCEVFSQLAEVNPNVPWGNGFSFDDLKKEIDAGYPVLLCLQPHGEMSRPVGSFSNANPEIHGMLAYGYYVTDGGTRYVRYRDSWAGGDYNLCAWTSDAWAAGLPLRGVIGYHPLPKILSTSVTEGQITLTWEGPTSSLYDAVTSTTRLLHWYIVERAAALDNQDFVAVSTPTADHQITLTTVMDKAEFYRVRLARPEEIPGN